MKKLVKILVGSDPELFPIPENIGEPFKDQTAPEIRAIAAKSSRKTTKSHPFWDPDHVHTSVTDRLVDFAFLNDPPTSTVCVQYLLDFFHNLMVLQGDPLANPILEALCRSFYEEEKWQRALMIHTGRDNEWISSVMVTMASLAATSVSTVLKLDA